MRIWMAKVSNQNIWRPKASFTTFLKCWTLEYELTHVIKFIELFQKRKFYSINFKSRIWNKISTWIKRMKYWRSIHLKKWNNQSKVTYLCYLLLQKLPHSISFIFTSNSSGKGTPSFKSLLSCFHWSQAHIK